MQTKSFRIDRYISKKRNINRRDVKLMLAQGRIIINGETIRDVSTMVEEFDCVQCDGEVLQDKKPLYIMMNKPLGIVSATKDEQHKTVISLLNGYSVAVLESLHIVGRLDLNTSGLLLLTNDGYWSRRLMSPEEKVDKVYRVRLENALTREYISAFSEGMHFAFEDVMTRPAELEILSNKVARVTLFEGKYHQIKRMFGRFRNPVMALHRESIGNLILDEHLAPGQSRELSPEEVRSIAG